MKERMYQGSQLDAQDALLCRQIEVIDLRRLQEDVDAGTRRRRRSIAYWALFIIGVVAAFAMGYKYGH